MPQYLCIVLLMHCTNLCLQAVGSKCNPVRDALDLVMGLSQLFRYSPKRTALLNDLQCQLAPQAPSLKPLCPTRWTVRTGAINSVILNYSILCEALEEINTTTHDEYGRKASGYLAIMRNFLPFWSQVGASYIRWN